MTQRRARRWPIVAALLGLVAGGSIAGIAGAHVEANKASGTRLLPLLPLASGQLVVSVGDPPSWLPVAGRPVTVTLFSGPPSIHPAGGLNAYIGFQPTSRPCPSAAVADGGALVKIPGLYASADRVLAGSQFAPSGGARSGDYAASIRGVVLHGHGLLRACVWLSRSPRRPSPPTTQDIPILNGLLAASVSDVPGAAGGSDAYTLNALGVMLGFSYSIATNACGTATRGALTHVAPGEMASVSVSLPAAPCPTDAGQVTLRRGRATVGVLSYPTADAHTIPPIVASFGGCELDPVVGATLAAATAYVQSDGCKVGRLLVAPRQPGVPSGAVIEAQVDGGVAGVAPFGTAVDLVLGGRP